MPEYVPYLSSNLLSIKIPFLLPRGFSANFLLLLWYLCGGVCLWGLEGNILSLMFKQVFEDPVDTAQDILDRGLIPVVSPGNEGVYWFWKLKNSDNVLYQKLAKLTVQYNDFASYDYIIQYHVQGNATHVLLATYVTEQASDAFGLFHYSQEVIQVSNPYLGWVQHKLFHLSDELSKHILIYQQVCEILFNHFISH